VKEIYTGKTKDVYDLEDGDYLLQFKDSVTGEDGVFDPDANKVGLEIEGAGKAGLELTRFFFELLHEKNIPNHYIDADIENGKMKVIPAAPFGKGIEVICRYRSAGSFQRRYGLYTEEGDPLDRFVEFTLKDDQRNDPLITKEGLSAFGIVTEAEYDILQSLTREISEIIKEELEKHDVELYDIKLEFGKNANNQIIIIDEISSGNMHVFKDGKQLGSVELANIMLPDS